MILLSLVVATATVIYSDLLLTKAKPKARKVQRFIKQHCAMYEVLDTYGTRQVEWTYQAAHEWLSSCSEFAIIRHRATGELLASRSQP